MFQIFPKSQDGLQIHLHFSMKLIYIKARDCLMNVKHRGALSLLDVNLNVKTGRV